MQDILIKPLFTEKVTKSNTDQNKYSFIVSVKANKIEISRAVAKKFNVTVTSVNTVLNKGKVKTQLSKGGRFTGNTAKYKKAFVSLKSGDKIDLFEQV
ncbi:MAG: 50S ribosomal protein L23 [Ignavibacteriaceae bacterium]